VDWLVTLARNYNWTMVFTIHQPCNNIIALFVQLVLLAQGKLIHLFWHAGAMSSIFQRHRSPCPPSFNFGDYLFVPTSCTYSLRAVFFCVRYLNFVMEPKSYLFSNRFFLLFLFCYASCPIQPLHRLLHFVLISLSSCSMTPVPMNWNLQWFVTWPFAFSGSVDSSYWLSQSHGCWVTAH